jgi:16S rRNA (adenine1518-N6/adenine1519-N6)-dimethyltransferase
VVRLVPRDPAALGIDDPALFERVVRDAFGQRRKTLRNALQAVCTGERMLAAGIRPELRAEQLEVAEFIKLSNALARDAAATDIP